MIQRIQTIWLLLSCVTIFALFLFPYVQFFDSSGIAMALKVNGILNRSGGQNELSISFGFILQAIATVIIGVLPLVTITSYKNRKKQIILILITAALTILFGCWLFISASKAIENVDKSISIDNIGIGALLIPLFLVFQFLAMKGIKRDTKLIKSADRLR